jgi:hypothetical protein
MKEHVTPHTLVAAPENGPHDGRHDCDYFIGAWKAQHRLPRDRLKGSTEWEECGGATTARRLLDGVGNMGSACPILLSVR